MEDRSTCATKLILSYPGIMSQQDVSYACTVLRKADTDTKKLAALLIVGKLFAERSLSTSDKGKLLQLIEASFLLKLLNNHFRQVSTESTDADTDTDTSFSLDIVLHFIPSIVEEYEKCEQFFEILGKILRFVTTDKKKTSDENATETVVDCFRFINESFSHLEEHQIEHLTQCYLNYILKSCLSVKCPSGQLNELIADFSKQLDNAHFNSFLCVLCQQFFECQTMEKFKLCKLISVILRSQNSRSLSLDDAQWHRQVRDALFEMFQNKLNSRIRIDALELATQMALTFDDMNWIKTDRWNATNSKFFILLLRLVCIEVQVLLPFLFEGRECESLGSNSMGSLLILLEKILFDFINNLEEDGDTKNDLLQIDSDTIIHSITAIRDTMRKVIEFIKEACQLDHPVGAIPDILVASIRLLCAYITQENDVLENELAEVMPFILNQFKYESNVQLSGIKLQLMAALRTLNEDDAMRAIILQHDIQIEPIDAQ